MAGDPLTVMRIATPRKRPPLFYGAAALPVLFFILFFLFPLVTALTDSFRSGDGGITLEHYAAVLGSRYYLKIILFTFVQAFISMLFSLLLGLPGAYIFSHFSFPGKKFLRALTTVPFVLPSILVVLGFIMVFGNSGIINRVLMELFGLKDPPLSLLYSFPAIILAHGFYNFPIAIRVIGAAWEQTDRREIEAAQMLGASGVKRFGTVTLPAIGPSIMAAGTLIFLYCFLSFAVILVLGGGPRLTTTEVEVYRLVRFSLDFSRAGALAFIQALLTLGFLYLHTLIQKRTPASTGTGRTAGIHGKRIREFGKPGAAALIIALYFILLLFLILMPMGTVVVRSFQSSFGWGGDTHLTLEWYRNLFTSGSGFGAVKTGEALLNTAVTGAGSATIALCTGLVLTLVTRRTSRRTRELMKSAILLPLGISTVLLGIGYYRIMHLLGVKEGNVLFLLLAHSVISLPFIVRVIEPALSGINSNLRSAASMLGAPPGKRFFTIELPLIAGSIAAAWLFAFSISAGEVNTALVLAPPGFSTLPLAIYRLIGSYNYYGACALGSILILFCTAAFYGVDRFFVRYGL